MSEISLSNPAGAERQLVNAISVDVEDYFQVSAFEPIVDRRRWSDFDCRIERNMERILELFDQAGVRGTFFCLGWVAERYPSLLRRVADLGHEVASHGFSHVQVSSQTQEQFRDDIRRTKGLLEDVTGQEVIGYRAASFSIATDNEWAHDELAAAGHRYSSSSYPIRHDRYGAADQPRFPFRRGQAGLIEIPVTPVELNGARFPCAGGGYFRLWPYSCTRWGIGRINRKDGQPVVFYFHPWELDPDQPRLSGANRLSRFRHYINLSGVDRKLRRLLDDFRWGTVANVFNDVLRN